MWRNEHSTETPASSEAVWDVWTDVSEWPSFLHMKWARLDGEFAAGRTGRLKPTTGPASKFTIVALDPGHRYVTEASMPGAKMRFEHEVASLASGGTRMTERQTIDGPLSGVYGLLLGRQMLSDLPPSLEKLGDLAQQRARGSATDAGA
jgi:uncharacterized protein YndB with AHSA1/START domain